MSAARVSPGQLRALVEAERWVGVSAADLDATMVTVTGAERRADMTAEQWGDLIDRFVVCGFRHPLVPMVTAVQLATLDEMRRFVGLDGRSFVALVRDLGGVSSRRRLNGDGFLQVWAWLVRHGADVPVPGHGFMTARLMRLVHEAAYELSIGAAGLQAILAPVAGVLRTSQLDRRGFLRVMLGFHRMGAPEPAPAPRVAASAGMVTQAQVNLLWRAWLDVGGWKDDTSAEALDAAIGSMMGMEGGLASLTRRGAAGIIDEFMVPRLNDRRAAEGAEGPPDGGPPGG